MTELIGIEEKATCLPLCRLLNWFIHLLSLPCQMLDFLREQKTSDVGSVLVCSEEFLMDDKMSPTAS